MKKAVLVLGAYLVVGILLIYADLNLPGEWCGRSWIGIAGYLCLSVPIGSLLGLLLIIPHELGHILVGRKYGYHLAFLQVLGFQWVENSAGRFWFRWGFNLFPLVYRSQYKKETEISEVRKIILAGPIASVVMALIFLPLLLWPQAQNIGFVIVGAYLLYAFSSFFGSEEMPSDGCLLRFSYRDPEAFLKTIRIQYDEIVTWQRPKNYDQTLLKLNGKADHDIQIHMSLYWKAMDAGQVEQAGQDLRAALALVEGGCKGKMAVDAAHEAAMYYRRFNQNEELFNSADRYCEELDNENEKRIIVEGAKLWVSGQKEAAKATWKVFADEFEAKQKRPGDIAHGRDWFLRLCTEDMIFETDRLFARLWRDEDLSQLIKIYIDPDVREYLGPSQPSVPGDIGAKLAGRIRNQQDFEPGMGAWALIRKDDEKLIGAVFSDRHSDGEIEIAWHLGQEFWGCGYATEAASVLKDYVFSKLPAVQRLRAVVHPLNTASQKVARKIGMTSLGLSDVHYGVMLEVFEIVR